MTIQMVEGVPGDIVTASDQVAGLGGVGETAHVAFAPEQAGADVEGAACVQRLQSVGPGVGGAGGNVVKGEADGRSGQVQSRRAAMRQPGEAAAQLALQADVGGIGLDHIASA
ncbi:hypothetical protein D3C71_707600 [compost metagenome]